MDVRELTEDAERREAVPILRQLWSDATPAEVLEWTGDDDYHLFGGFVEGELVGVAGVLVKHVLHHARHAWLYDLVVDEPQRERGYGTALVNEKSISTTRTEATKRGDMSSKRNSTDEFSATSASTKGSAMPL